MSSNKKAIDDKKTYVEAHPGLPPFDDAPSTLRLDKHASAVAGAAFDALKHSPNDPEVRAAYDALKREVKAQYDHVVSRGLRVLPWTREGQPYENSKDLREKVGRTHEIYYFPTRAGFGSGQDSSDHPLNEQVPGMPEGTVYNDLFRAVHDYFGHVMHPHEFGPQGELRAWHEHARMFTPEARKALTTETHGQNSWVNFGPHDPQKLPVTERPYAEQKAAVLPAEHHPVKLARVKIDPPSELERHAVAAMQNRKDPMALHVFADHVEEHHPNSVWLPVIREMQSGGDWRAKVREAKKIYTAEKRRVPQSTPWTGAANIGGVYFHPELNEWRVGSEKTTVAPSHWWDENEAVDPRGNVDGKKTTMDRALHLLRNMPGGVDNVIGMALAAHFFAENRGMRAENAERLKLARLGPAVTGRTHTGETRYTHEFTDDEGTPLGTLSLVPREKALHVDWVGLHGAAAGEQAGVAGAKHIRSLLPQIATAYPQHEILMGRRAGGAHRGELRGVELAPHRLARTGMIDSTNHRKRVELAKKVLSEAGFGRAVVKAALAHYGREQQPGVLAAIEQATNPRHALYTAAWVGMLTQQPRVSVFHPGDGQDALHVITSPHPTEHVSEYLRRAGVPRFSSERTATGTRAFVLDPDGQLNPAAWSAGLDGQHTTLRGKAHTLEGRGAYQKAIREAEEATNASNSGAE